MRPALLLAPALLVALSGDAAGASGAAGTTGAARSASDEPSDDALRAAWSALSAADRKEAIAYLRAEIDRLQGLQLLLLRAVLARAELERELVPPAGPPAAFDPLEHAPDLPIPRQQLAADDRRVVALRTAWLPKPDPHALLFGWRWDWGERALRRVEGDDLERCFENALRGHPPDLDLALALVSGALDRGEEHKALGAFAHVYSDREGNVYPGLTLYDAWNSGRTIEMPDVDTLGIVHTVLGDWKTWRSPVPASRHDALYARIGELFTAAHRYRGLREALADAHLIGTPAARDGYGVNLVRFHALWEEHANDPGALAPELPDAAGWDKFLKAWVARCNKSPELMEKGRTRQARLDEDARAVRARLVFVLQELGAFEPGAPGPAGGR